MVSGLYTAASGLMAQMAKMEVLSHNLANTGTPGFKGDFLLLEGGAQGGLQPAFLKGGPVPGPQPVKAGRRITDFGRGLTRQTDNPLDVANSGPGYFVVETPHGLRYTRAGNFALDAKGTLTTLDGNPLQGNSGAIHVPDGRFSVDASGSIMVEGQEVDRLRIVNPDPASLIREGGSLFALKPIAQEPAPADGVEIRQGFLEGSNVDPVLTLVQIMASLRATEAYEKVIHALDQTLGQAANELGRM
jgi:flagellar basal-body rod protein FlgF